MVDHNWIRQTKDKPLFPELIWSRPENKRLAGKLFIVGGNLHGFAAPAVAFAAASKAGIGSVRVTLPDRLSKTVDGSLEADFAASTSVGSFAQTALSQFLDNASWSDGTILAGDFGHNSETAILLEKFADKYQGQLTITKDAADYFTLLPRPILNRENTLMVISIAQLQKLVRESSNPSAVTFDMDLLRLSQALSAFTQAYSISLIVKHLGNIFVGVNGKVSITQLQTDQSIWRVETAAAAATWWLQNPGKSFETITTSLVY